MKQKHKDWIIIGTGSLAYILFIFGVLYAIGLFYEDKEPGVNITNEIEEWDYKIYGWKTVESPDKSYSRTLPIMKIYGDSYCDIILYNKEEPPVEFTINLTIEERTGQPPRLLGLESNDTSELNYTYTCYGRFIGIANNPSYNLILKNYNDTCNADVCMELR